MALLRERIEATSRGWNIFLVPCLFVLAHALLLEGRVEEAARAANRAAELARRFEERGNEAHALRVLGSIAAQNASPEAVPAAPAGIRHPEVGLEGSGTGHTRWGSAGGGAVMLLLLPPPRLDLRGEYDGRRMLASEASGQEDRG
jgi:hypothetical protein